MMEEELFFTGYCRILDGSRTVEVITLEGKFQEADCRYGDCLYQSTCPIAQRMDELPRQ